MYTYTFMNSNNCNTILLIYKTLFNLMLII